MCPGIGPGQWVPLVRLASGDSMNILLVEDDDRIARLVARSLLEHGDGVEIASDGFEALTKSQEGRWDAIVLDVMLPGVDGVEVCRRLRNLQLRTPIIMLTARDGIADRVKGLDAGADDYLVKPFALEELHARLRALGRRGGTAVVDQEMLQVGDLVVDLSSREVRRGGKGLEELTAKEFALLTYLMSHAGQTLTRDQILSHVWGYDAESVSNVVDIFIHYLRDKIDRGFARPLIRTVRGVGYLIKE